jgi:excisionase family DNA binding protein
MRITTPDVLSRHEAADYLHISISALGNLLAAGQVPSIKIGRRRVFLRSSLDAWMAALETTAPTGGTAA